MQTKYKIIISIFVILGILYALQFAVSFIANEKKKESNMKSFEERFEGSDVYMDVLRASEDYFMRNKNLSIDVKAQALDELATESKIKELSGLPYSELEKRVVQHINSISKTEKYKDDTDNEDDNTGKDDTGKDNTGKDNTGKDNIEKYADVDIHGIVDKTDKILTDLASLKIDLQLLKNKSIGTNEKPAKKEEPKKDSTEEPRAKQQPKTVTEDREKEIEPPTKKPVPATPVTEKQNKPVKENFIDFDGVYGFENMRSFAAF